MFDKVITFASDGKGRRLLNALNKRDVVLTGGQLDEVLKTYGEIGLPKEVQMLKTRRGILRDDQYNDLARKVKDNCCAEKVDDFMVTLRDLLCSGMKMNPTRMEDPA